MKRGEFKRIQSFCRWGQPWQGHVRTMGSKSEPLGALASVSSGKSVGIGVPTQGLKWRGAVGWWPTFSPMKSMAYLVWCRGASRSFLAIIVQQLPQGPFGIAEKGTHDPVVLGLFRTNGADDVTVQG